MTEESSVKKTRTVGFGAFVIALVAFIAMGALAGYIFYSESNNIKALQQSYDQQSQLLTSLSNNYTSLYNQYTALQNNYESLQQSYLNLSQIANLQENETVTSNTVFHIPMNNAASVQVTSSYAGYIQVHINATAPVTLTFTNYKYLVTTYYPVSGSAISSGSFILPVLDGMSYLEIYAPSTSDSTVTVTVILFF